MTTTAIQTRKPRQLNTSRIIERPRLFALLDESSARVRMLVAPAGYGKTTLAEQWVRRDGRQSAWFTARHSSTDVAALALGLATAATELVPGCDLRLREHLRALPAPADDPATLVEILAEDISGWPASGWLVLDEYDEIARAVESERFVAALIHATSLQVLVASRQRPSWATARDVLYGEYFELGQPVLAMNSAEAAEVLADERIQVASGLAALAGGWPAVIGLAAVAGAEVDSDVEHVPESLYRFFADEVYSALTEDIRAGLATIAIAPVLDDELMTELLGAARAATVRDAAVDVGILVERGARLDLHPLCRAFLEERSQQLGLFPGPESIDRCLEQYRARRDWDAAFDLIVRRDRTERLESVLHDALDEFLETARLSTLEEWCGRAPAEQTERPVFLLARSEVALRRGRYATAQSCAEAAASHPDSDIVFRALSAAARAAHLASREDEGLELYRRAEVQASTEAERRDALWGQLRCLIDLERQEALPTFAELAKTVGFADPREVVRCAGHRLHLQLRFGSIDIAEADRASELIEEFRDPLVATSFKNVYASALVLLARYNEALGVARNLIESAERYRLDFAQPHALCSVALAHAGLRQWGHADAGIRKAIALAQETRDAHACQMGFAILSRILAQQGQHQKALLLQMPPLRDALASARAEAIASRALVLALMARVEDAKKLIVEVEGTTSAVEPQVLIAAVEAVCALKRRDSSSLERIAALEMAAFDSGALDLLVTAYRSSPDILALLLRSSRDRDRLAALIRQVGDTDLASQAGHSVAMDADPLTRLTPREREIYEFLVRGVSDREIAETLVISRATAKRHVQNIYNKLELRSRAAIAVHAALSRAGQATAATTTEGSDAAS